MNPQIVCSTERSKCYVVDGWIEADHANVFFALIVMRVGCLMV